jgi:hypothetical protein
MVPSYLGTSFKMFKTLSRGRAFKQIINQLVNTVQMSTPLHEIVVNMVSDQEAVMTVNECSHLKRMSELAKKPG